MDIIGSNLYAFGGGCLQMLEGIASVCKRTDAFLGP